MFIDKATIEVRAGNGGNGMIAFHREKFISRGGPSGGNGGRGGSIIFRASKSVNTLMNFRHSKCIIARDGEKGMGKNQYGKSADDVVVELPIGTVVLDEKTKEFICDLSEDGKEFVVAHGGRGGRGNACFKSPVNRTPRIAENGMPGERKRLILELKLLADVGFVGFPSVGKSTLLSIISAAKPEIGDYDFTTIVPNLGVVRVGDGRSFVAADLPGLIEGAHLGRGLGLQFLRHIERCRVIVHIIDMSGIRDPYDDYQKIKKELKEYGYGLSKRPVIIVASKMDEEGAEERLAALKKRIRKPIIGISALTNENIDLLCYKIADLLDKTPMFSLYNEENIQAGVKVYEAKASSDDEFEIFRKDNHTFIIKGERIERTYSLINLSTDEGILKLLNYMRKIGVDDRLRMMGAKDGDTVILCDFEFEYIA
ncbi:MAG: GTPase ObgE [Erysipelotrichales bacterium]|nr:GTPase ObgE [Erysipelotrichales bacterium]